MRPPPLGTPMQVRPDLSRMREAMKRGRQVAMGNAALIGLRMRRAGVSVAVRVQRRDGVSMTT